MVKTLRTSYFYLSFQKSMSSYTSYCSTIFGQHNLYWVLFAEKFKKKIGKKNKCKVFDTSKLFYIPIH